MFPSEFNYLLCFQGARSEEFKGFETGSMATHTHTHEEMTTFKDVI